MNDEMIEKPDYLFECSWEVCNKVGGIYTVLSTKAYTLQEIYPERILFIGPDWNSHQPADFVEDETLFAEWKTFAANVEKINVRTGRWDVAGKPLVILVDFKPFLNEKDRLYYRMWEQFGVDSLNAYGDYDESCAFACASAKTIESFYRFHKLENRPTVALFNEWMLGMGALYVQDRLPEVATVFTTHATSIGRSIAGNGKPLYSNIEAYSGDQMASELNMAAKHSLEKQTALHVDCFTTVSDITAIECRQLLEKAPDIVTPNGFERNFVPSGESYEKKRTLARSILINVAEKLFGASISPNVALISTSGRYEYRNKGIDVFIEAMDLLRRSGKLKDGAVAFVMVPAWTIEARSDLKYMLDNNIWQDTPLQFPFLTHWFHNMESDCVTNCIREKKIDLSDDLKIIFVPSYLNGDDGIFNLPYYDLLTGMDVTVYPSYYEPWGYTPLESIAFGVPTVTTSLSGFGLWARKEGLGDDLRQGVRVIERTDDNFHEVANSISQSILTLCSGKRSERKALRGRCQALAAKAEWSNFIEWYRQAYSIALRNAAKRNGKKLIQHKK